MSHTSDNSILYTEFPVKPPIRFSLFSAAIWSDFEPSWARLRDLYLDTGNAMGLAAQQEMLRWLDEQEITYHWEWQIAWQRNIWAGPEGGQRRILMLDHLLCFDRAEDAVLFRLFHDLPSA